MPAGPQVEHVDPLGDAAGSTQREQDPAPPRQRGEVARAQARQRGVEHQALSGPPHGAHLRQLVDARPDIDDGAVVEPDLSAERLGDRVDHRRHAAFVEPHLLEPVVVDEGDPLPVRGEGGIVDALGAGKGSRVERASALEPQPGIVRVLGHHQLVAVGRERQRGPQGIGREPVAQREVAPARLRLPAGRPPPAPRRGRHREEREDPRRDGRPARPPARPRERRPGRAAVDPTVATPGRLSASANCAAVANRSAGSFDSAVSTAASTCGGIVFRCSAERARLLGHHPRDDRLRRRAR